MAPKRQRKADSCKGPSSSHHEEHSPPPPPPPPFYSNPPHAGEGSGASTAHIEQAIANLTAQVQALAQAQQAALARADSQHYDYYSRRVYDYHVDRGHIEPHVNYPYHPPQEGPVPNWEPERIDGTRRTGGTYPYWQGPGSSRNPPNSFPPFNYRLPGGSDPRGDPAFPHPSFPPNYTGGWEPHGPPIDMSPNPWDSDEEEP